MAPASFKRVIAATEELPVATSDQPQLPTDPPTDRALCSNTQQVRGNPRPGTSQQTQPVQRYQFKYPSSNPLPARIIETRASFLPES